MESGWGIETELRYSFMCVSIHAAIGADSDYCIHSCVLPPLPPSPFFQVATWQEKMEVFNVNMGNVGKGGKGGKGVKGVKGKDDKCMIM